jgi:hypothetical protein
MARVVRQLTGVSSTGSMGHRLKVVTIIAVRRRTPDD